MKKFFDFFFGVACSCEQDVTICNFIIFKSKTVDSVFYCSFSMTFIVGVHAKIFSVGKSKILVAKY